MTTPTAGLEEWDSALASPWLKVQAALRVIDAFLNTIVVEEFQRNGPPASCADGARYHIGSSPSGEWIGHAGELAVAVGANASNGWKHAIIAREGVTLHDKSTDNNYFHDETGWTAAGSDGLGGISRLLDLLDVNESSRGDGFVLTWDESTQEAYFAPGPDHEWALNFTSDGDLYIPVRTAMTIDMAVAPIGTGSIAFSKSTAAAPGTFSGTTLPVTLQAGAYLKVAATGVSGFLAFMLARSS